MKKHFVIQIVDCGNLGVSMLSHENTPNGYNYFEYETDAIEDIKKLTNPKSIWYMDDYLFILGEVYGG
jgi:hypothetical protein